MCIISVNNKASENTCFLRHILMPITWADKQHEKQVKSLEISCLSEAEHHMTDVCRNEQAVCNQLVLNSD